MANQDKLHGGIVDRAQAEKAIQESEAKYRSIFETAANLITSVNDQGIIVDCNKRITEFLGYERDEIINQPMSKIIHPDSLEKAQESLNEILTEGSSYNKEYKMVTKDDAIIYVSINSSRIKNDADNTFRTICIIDNITERKWMEEHLKSSEEYHRSFIESSQDCICNVDANGAMMSLNDSGYILNDIDPSENIMGDSFTASITEHQEDVEQAISQATKGKNISVQYKTVTIKGREVWWDTRLTPVKDIDDSIRSVMIVARDITERKRAEEEIKLYSEKLQQSNQELQDFAYVASHDLQEPLRKVTAFGDRLMSKFGEPLGEQGRDYISRMQNAAERMQGLIDGLLSFSRVTTKAKPFEPVDLSTVAKEVISDLEIRIEQTGGKVEIDELPTIDADPLQMRQLLQNLIGNALKFNKPDEPPVVKVKGEFIQDEGKGVNASPPDHELYQLTIEDNGIGFDEQHTDRIFGVFQRLHGRNEYEGTGIGLSVCKKIAERHGGQITATSTQGRGAKFIATLPVRQHSADAEEELDAEVIKG